MTFDGRRRGRIGRRRCRGSRSRGRRRRSGGSRWRGSGRWLGFRLLLGLLRLFQFLWLFAVRRSGGWRFRGALFVRLFGFGGSGLFFGRLFGGLIGVFLR